MNSFCRYPPRRAGNIVSKPRQADMGLSNLMKNLQGAIKTLRGFTLASPGDPSAWYSPEAWN